MPFGVPQRMGSATVWGHSHTVIMKSQKREETFFFAVVYGGIGRTITFLCHQLSLVKGLSTVYGVMRPESQAAGRLIAVKVTITKTLQPFRT